MSFVDILQINLLLIHIIFNSRLYTSFKRGIHQIVANQPPRVVDRVELMFDSQLNVHTDPNRSKY